MSLEELPKKIQYITVDSGFVNGSNNTFSIDFGLESNIFLREIKDVIGVKLIDFYVTQIGENGVGTDNVAKYIDIVCPDIPTPAQILNERHGQILGRIAIECNFGGSNVYVQHDKQWKGSVQRTTYFNPIALKKLNFEIYELQGDGDYVTLQPDASFYFILEITTIDHKAHQIDNSNELVIEAIDRLGRKIDKFNSHIKKVPDRLLKEPEPKKKVPLRYIGGTIVVVAALIYYTRSRGGDVRIVAARP